MLFYSAKIVAAKDLLLGAVLSSFAWQILASFAGVLIARDLKHAQAIAGFFGVILGLLAWFGLQAAATVYAMEVDVVRARHLWPRSVTQPPLTDADKRFIENAIQAEVRRPEQIVTIEFTPEADRDPRHPPDASIESDQ
jgi:membrane protein